MQVLLMLRQTVDERDPNITLKVNGPWVKLGSYLDCIHRAAGEELGSRELEIDFTFLEHEYGYNEDESLWSSARPVDFKACFGYDGEVFLKQMIFFGDSVQRVAPQEYVLEGRDVSVRVRKFYGYSIKHSDELIDPLEVLMDAVPDEFMEGLCVSIPLGLPESCCSCV